MKSPDQTAFKAILITTMIIALAMLPFVAKAESQHDHSPPGKPMKGAASAPAFTDLDTDNNGSLSEDELLAGQKAHRHEMQKMHGKGMKKPTFGDLDLDGDGCINAGEFAVHQAERHGKKSDQ
jgi:hypothetical protein